MGNLLPPAFPRVGYLAILINTCSSVFQSYFKLTKLTLLGGGGFFTKPSKFELFQIGDAICASPCKLATKPDAS